MSVCDYATNNFLHAVTLILPCLFKGWLYVPVLSKSLGPHADHAKCVPQVC